ncbi:hypothetical protein D3C71_1799790 [compost metagenome]
MAYIPKSGLRLLLRLGKIRAGHPQQNLNDRLFNRSQQPRLALIPCPVSSQEAFHGPVPIQLRLQRDHMQLTYAVFGLAPFPVRVPAAELS